MLIYEVLKIQDFRKLLRVLFVTHRLGTTALNKQEFKGAICMRERHSHSLCWWRDKLCGSQSHLRKLGGYTCWARHNSVRDCSLWTSLCIRQTKIWCMIAKKMYTSVRHFWEFCMKGKAFSYTWHILARSLPAVKMLWKILFMQSFWFH